MRCLVTRPEPEASRLAARLARRNHEAITVPVLDIQTLDASPDLNGCAGLIFTSKNGLRAFLDKGLGFSGPVYTVGKATAEMARKAGLDVQATGRDAQALARHLIEGGARGPLLHLSGRQVSFDIGKELENSGIPCRRTVLYDARPAAGLKDKLQEIFRKERPDSVFLYSPRTAQILAKALTEGGLAPTCRAMTAFALSPAVADAAAVLSWGRIITARKPVEDAMLAALDELEETQRE